MPHEANRVTIARSEIDEWYVHGPMGLEQGFTIPAPLAAPGAPSDRVRLEMAIEGKYRPTMRGDVIVWTSRERTLETRELYAFDADGKRLPASMRASDERLSIDVDVTGARYPLRSIRLAGTTEAHCQHGCSARMVRVLPECLGRYRGHRHARDGDNEIDSGSAYVFFRNGTTWETQQKLFPSDGAAGDQFGISVSLDGNTAIIGAYQDDDRGADSGSAYVFVRSGSVWSEQQKLLAWDERPTTNSVIRRVCRGIPWPSAPDMMRITACSPVRLMSSSEAELCGPNSKSSSHRMVSVAISSPAP